MEASSKTAEPPPKSSFGQRFSYLLVYQRTLGKLDKDKEFAGIVALSQSRVSEYKGRTDPPPADVCLSIAQRAGVDPGWLTFGAESLAPRPVGFDLWLAGAVARGPVAPKRSVIVVAQPSSVSYGRAAKKKRPPREA